jgi:hypothetical protein
VNTHFTPPRRGRRKIAQDKRSAVLGMPSNISVSPVGAMENTDDPPPGRMAEIMIGKT